MNQPDDVLNSGPTPAQTALAVARAHPVAPTSVVRYVSRGYLLIVATASCLEAIIDEVPETLQTHVVLTDACPSSLRRALHARGIEVRDNAADLRVAGYLGAFSITIGGGGESAFDVPAPGFDLVFDLMSPALAPQPIPPVGYFALGHAPGKWARTLARLPDWIGEFDKPRYFDYNESICAHGERGVEGCRLCIDVCDTQAIRSENLELRINPNLCQGCGDCTTVCPSGALSYAYPSRQDSLERIRLLLVAYFDAGGKVPVLLLHDAHIGKRWLAKRRASLAINVLPYELESLTAAGIDMWLSALAYGAERVLLLDSGHLSANNRRSLNEQLDHARRILQGLGLANNLVDLVQRRDLLSRGMPVRSNRSLRQIARYAGIADKRSAIRKAVDHLLTLAPIRPEAVELASNAPFGTLEIDPGRCTLCMACVSICPEAALLDGGERPQIRIRESLCVQCGLCARICPESAVKLKPRYLYDSRLAGQPRLLHEGRVFHCIVCGKPFATESGIRAVMDKLKAHPMFQGDNARRLQMCDECRVKALFTESKPDRSDRQEGA